MSPAPSRPSLRPSLRRAVPAGLAVLALALAGCGQSDADADTGASSGSAGSETEGYPVTVDNCGIEVTLDSAPERVVAIKSTSVELMLALGLGDNVVAHAFPDGPVPDEWADAAAGITLLSEKAPSQEVVLEQEPDLVLAGWESNLAADTAGERDDLADLGVATYVSPAACQEAPYAPDPMTFGLLFDQLEEAGAVLGAPEAAAELVADQRAELEGAGRAADGTTALWWSSGTDTPFVGGGTGAPQMVMEAVGLDNVAGDVDQAWTSLGWESVIEADPDVLVLVDADWNQAATKIDFLESNAATKELTAVKEKRYLTVPMPAAEAGVRSVPAVLDLADQLGALGLLAGDGEGDDG
ncbi:putative F420-0 ABC transporter substrate-binding protein [Nocardioides solisilvae]|uniref:putative F420-0 ABC transporter substrate-binding protein n=1 Tax=Nocardioides solisilvae TaxID=1542435 RepID=UPI000D74D082|nr:putative F420-0 ABC transporter substrate-binding protein [Nocardioides solisilvae]